tara:strand:+ start:663 stop:1496 length:834 start_codon:yes stop_codon:yes gene_type:complete
MYYPKSQLQTDLYTNGGEFKLTSGGTEYIGNYFIAQGNKVFSGKNPNDKPNFNLSPYTGEIPINSTLGEVLPDSYYLIDDQYDFASNIDSNRIPPSTPTQITPVPTEENYQTQEFQRYFLKKINEIKYIEISQEEFTKYLKQEPNVSWQLYTPIKLPWEISGNRNNVYNVNKNTVNRVQLDLNLPGFKSYFKERYDQLFKYTPQENLYTSGNEFKLVSNGGLYEGYYHIHSKKGPMVGRQHSNIEHEYLLPISGSNNQAKLPQQEIASKNYRKSSGY